MPSLHTHSQAPRTLSREVVHAIMHQCTLTVKLKEIKTFCCSHSQPGDDYFQKLHDPTKLLMSYKPKFVFGDFLNKSNFRIGNELGLKSYCWRISV